MITNRVGAPGWPRGFQTAPAVLSRVDANERRTKMRMFNVLPRLIKNTVKNLTHFTCNSPNALGVLAGSGLKNSATEDGLWYNSRHESHCVDLPVCNSSGYGGFSTGIV
jgi:hypothetical protein